MEDGSPSEAVLVRADHMTFDWPGGQGVDVAEVRVVLSDLALHFSAPIHLDGNTIALILVAPDLGPVSVVQGIIEERDLTTSEVNAFCHTFQSFEILIGRSADLAAAKSFIRRTFPSWAQVVFFDEHETRPVAAEYHGPSSPYT